MFLLSLSRGCGYGWLQRKKCSDNWKSGNEEFTQIWLWDMPTLLYGILLLKGFDKICNKWSSLASFSISFSSF